MSAITLLKDNAPHTNRLFELGPNLGVTYTAAGVPILDATTNAIPAVEVQDSDTGAVQVSRIVFQGPVVNVASGIATLNLDGRYLTSSSSIAWANLTGVPVYATRWPTFAEVTSKPTTLAGYGITDAAPLSHTHAAGDITSGTLAEARLPSSVARKDQANAFSGNITINSPSTLSFGSTIRQMLNLYGTAYGAGVQDSTLYLRTGSRFSVFSGGSHSDLANNPGTGGSVLLELTSTVFKWNGDNIATQGYVDLNYLPLTGGSLSGGLTVGSTLTSALGTGTQNIFQGASNWFGIRAGGGYAYLTWFTNLRTATGVWEAAHATVFPMMIGASSAGQFIVSTVAGAHPGSGNPITWQQSFVINRDGGAGLVGNLTANGILGIGRHPSYPGYAGVWRNGNGEYMLLADATDLYVNANAAAGTIYFGQANSYMVHMNGNGLYVKKGWLRFSTGGTTGITWEGAGTVGAGMQLVPASPSELRLQSGDNTGAQLRLNRADGGIYGYLYGDAAGFGLLGPSHSWKVRVTDAALQLYGTITDENGNPMHTVIVSTSAPDGRQARAGTVWIQYT